METKINIAEILKDKPEGTKLWTDMFGSVTLYVVTVACDAFQVKHHNKEPWFDENGKMYEEGVLCIYPSKSMRDWEKFTWKKDDVLVNSSGFKLFFDRWANDDYTRFFGKVNLLENSFSYETEKYTLASKDENLDTLEIEKPEFKDGDIAFADFGNRQYVFIVSGKTNLSEGYYSFIVLNLNSTKALSLGYKTSFFKENLNTIRLATEEEKKQLFSALEKEGKAWDAKKKAIVDLKPKVELKPFDKVLVRNDKEDQWSANIFSYQVRDNMYYCLGECYWRYCIPYEGNEHLLGTTKDVEG